MTLLEEVENFFSTKNLYEVLNVKQDASEQQIKKAYRKASLLIHPDRVGDSEKEKATQKFQTLARVHYILSDPAKRKLYDDQGIIDNEDSLESDYDWADYWRLLFPKIGEQDIQNFLDKYAGSKDEEEDLIGTYERFEGDMDKISETHIAYDEDRTSALIAKLISEGKVTAYDNFTMEPKAKKDKRKRRSEREAKQAAREKKAGKDVDDMSDLKSMIQKRSQGNFDSMIANLEAKYGKPKASKAGSRGVKRKRQLDDEGDDAG